eukprot:CAMPEP_0195118130 /NCGR_PEP_ID=MMETSP0448-20130528/116192_1 /TAXON_ID=66468 /ORGANISM="Heterocapsa triquestra, Strain CCMP 448" /LENGTH=76 /DNA_ID=CAMNT_0040155381 /DNA_START=12 /DNA_END=239 /DNA_ORIENTATION=-
MAFCNPKVQTAMAAASDCSASPTSNERDLISQAFATCLCSPKAIVSSLGLTDPKDRQEAHAKLDLRDPKPLMKSDQ